VDAPTDKETRGAAVAHALSRAVRADEVNAIDACRILRHELRRANTNRAHLIEFRSEGAEASIQRHQGRPPKNGSDDALHADHVYPFTPELLYEVSTLDAWKDELRRLSRVVCVTAKENYALEQVEKSGHAGPTKYAAAGVTFATPLPW
jgi:hypothetical protein